MSEHIEVEIKIPLSREVYSDMDQRLRSLGAEWLGEESQIDTYYDHPSRQFQQTDEALRIRIRNSTDISRRQVSVSERPAELTYKGPRVDTLTKTRVELTVRVDNGEDMDRLLIDLGFRPVATLTKHRMFYRIDDAVISLDDVQGLGLFAEFEIGVCNNQAISSARDHLFRLIERLGLDTSQSIRRSYLELFLQQP